MNDLKRCPFCDGEAEDIQQPGSYGPYNLTFIRCMLCGATAPNDTKWDARTCSCSEPIEEKKPFYEGCKKRLVQYEHESTVEALVFCDHKDNPDTCEGNCQEGICPKLKGVTP